MNATNPAPLARMTPGTPMPMNTAEKLDAFIHKLLAANDEAPRVPFGPPLLPPGVVPRVLKASWPLAMDACDTYGWLNGAAGASYCGMNFPGYPYLSNLSQRSEYRAPVETIANELTREWLKLTGGSEDKQKELNKALADFGVREVLRTGVLHDGFFGLGHIAIQVVGQDTDKARRQPLTMDDEGNGGLGKGKLLGFKNIEPMWTTPYAYNSNDPSAPDFYKPTVWFVMGRPTHATRMITICSRPVPDVLKPAYNFGGLSLSQLCEPYVQRWLKTVDSVNRLISNFSKTVIETDMQAILSDGDGGGDFIKRMQLFNAVADNRGIMALNKGTETMLQVNTPLSGLSELQAQAQEHMAAPTHIPLVKLTGVTPAGLNASSDGEIKVFYDWCAGEQENTLSTPFEIMYRAVQLHLWGKVDPDIGYEWVKLDSPTDKELAEMRKSDGDRDGTYVDKGIVSPDEVRTRLRDDPNSGYTGLVGDAPTPPLVDGLETEHELGQAAAEADHERGKETAEQAAVREKEAREHEAKLERAKPKGASDAVPARILAWIRAQLRKA